MMNVVTFCSFSVCLRDLWRAQGINAVVRRSMNFPNESWRRWFDFKKEEWKATGVMVLNLLIFV